MPGLSTRHQATPSLTLLSPISQSTRASPYCVATVEALEEGAECREEGRGAGVAWRLSLLLREAGPEGLNHPHGRPEAPPLIWPHPAFWFVADPPPIM